jgi:poly-gamma-glutamate synthesis protein (capsule biosynthesis protein)
MLNRLTKAIIIICGLVVFEVALLSLISIYSKADNSAPIALKPEVHFASTLPEYELASGIVPHHDLAKDISDKFWQTVSAQDKPETIVILSPDHFNSGNLDNQKRLMTVDTATTELSGVKVSADLLNKLSDQEFGQNTSAVQLDHGIGNLLGGIKQYLPQAQILPILIPANSERTQIIDFIQSLKNENNLLVVASTDFSHYLPENAADLHDVMSQRVILDFDVSQFERLEVDCWQCVYAARLYSSLEGKDDYEIIGSGNSAKISGTDAESTTSYFSVIFGKGNFPKQEKVDAKTLIFAGDMMFDRGVETLIKKNSPYYPLEQIKRFLHGVDYVSANLEGPIVKKTQDFGPRSLTFNFGQEILPVLKDANINLVTLANNHILNRGQQGFKEIKEFLTANQIDYSGEAFKCGADLAVIKDNIIFLGINKTFPTSCTDAEVAQTVKALKVANPNKFLIISIHWGVEYQTKNSSGQQKLGHLLIDNGADLIMGSHQHVVQNIEKYKDKLIFYSLGNFVFDQYFSTKTQQGLAIGLELSPDKQVYRIFPLQSKLSQPQLMASKEKGEFLKSLSADSSKELQEGIKNGVIEIER